MEHKGTENLKPLNTRTKEEQRVIATMGGKASGKARKEKATLRQTLEKFLEMNTKEGGTYKDLVTLGLLKGAMNGNPNNYKTIAEMIGEITGDSITSTPTLKIEVVDNGSLDKVLYETNRHNEDDK